MITGAESPGRGPPSPIGLPNLPLTNFNSPPDIYLPKQIDLKTGKFGELDHVQIKEAVAFLQDMRPTYSLGNGDDEPPRVVMPSFWTGEMKAAQEKRRIVSEHPVIQHMIFEPSM